MCAQTPGAGTAVALGNLYFAFEEPGRALGFYDRTLASASGHPEAMLGRIKSLSLLQRHDEAIEAIDASLNGPSRSSSGEAYFWRAWNDLRVGRLDEASKDIEQADRLWVNSEVAKLGGMIAYRRADLDGAKERFEAARTLNPGDCEAVYSLGLTYAEQRDWAATADTLPAASVVRRVVSRARRRR